MCGRFSLNITLEQIRQIFSADVVTCEWEPQPEVFLSQQVPAIIRHESGKRLCHYHQGSRRRDQGYS